MAVDTRNREERREARRQRLTDAAVRLFASKGFNDTSVDDIVAAARTSKSAFYEFWSSKEDCVRSLLDEMGGVVVNAVFEASAAGADHRDRLRRGIAEFVHRCYTYSDLARVLLIESIGVGPAVEEARHRFQARFAHLIEAEVRHNAGDDPYYEKVDPEVFGRAVVGAVHEATVHFLTQTDSDPEKVIGGLSAIFAPD
jgi:AcrR family transcriptional regulator